MGGRRVLEIGKEGCQQESGIPEHLVTGSRQNMSRWGPSYLYPACHYQGPQSSPPQQATHSRSFFCFWSLLYPSPPQLMRREGKKSFRNLFCQKHCPLQSSRIASRELQNRDCPRPALRDAYFSFPCHQAWWEKRNKVEGFTRHLPNFRYHTT